MAMSNVSRRRALGQHFLQDSSVITQIIDTGTGLAKTLDCSTVLEIGPGRGALTLPLMDRLEGRELLLAERDPEFVELWAPTVNDPSIRVRILAGDFLKLPETQWLPAPGQRLMVISNLPYSAGTAMVLRLAEHPTQIPAMVLMFQAEVAQRLRAQPGTKSWGSLSLWIQNCWDVSLLVSVPPKAFRPPPKVNSEVILLRPRLQARIPATPLWNSLLRVAFAQRRKMLRSSLPTTGPWRNALVASQLDGTKRAEALTWEEWQKLFECLEE